MKSRLVGFVALLVIIVAFGMAIFTRIEMADIREAACRTDCQNRMRQLALAIHAYHDDHGVFPPAVQLGEEGQPMHSWRALILPYLDIEGLNLAYDYDQPWNAPHNLDFARQLALADFFCPALLQYHWWGTRKIPDTPLTSYVAIVGPGTCFDGTGNVSFDSIEDGSSRSALLVEWARSDIQMFQPRDVAAGELLEMWKRSANRQQNSSPNLPVSCELSAHPAGVNIALADGSTRCVNRNTPLKTIQELTSIAAGDTPVDF